MACASLPRSALALVNSSAFACSTLAALAAAFDGAHAVRAHAAAFAAEGMEPAQLAAARDDVAALAEEYFAAAADTLPWTGGGGRGSPPYTEGAPSEVL